MTATDIPHREGKNPVPVPIEEAIDAINNYRRRMVIVLTDEYGADVTVGQLAEAIAALENDCRMSELDAQQRKRVYISLVQSHLKKLDRHGVVHYDKQQKIVVPTQATAKLATCIGDFHRLCET
jgi:hypothetical protein